MIPALTLGIRLVRAGGPMRAMSIAMGAAVATMLALAALAVPDAVYPPQAQMYDIWRANISGALLFALTPAILLLITTSRISSATRDRRLASLRLIGMGRGRAAAIAATEAGCQTAVGALVGVVGFVALSPVADRLVAAGPGWFAAPLRAPASTLALVALSVTAAGAGIAAAALLRRQNPIVDRARSARRRPSWWRLTVPILGAGLLLTLVVVGEETAQWPPEWLILTLVGGAVLAAVGIAVASPLLADLAATIAIRTGSVAGVLAGRGIHAEPLGTTRLVAGLAVAAYLVIGGSAVLHAFESTPQYQYALQTVEKGPQIIRLSAFDDTAPVTEPELYDPSQLDEIERVVAAVPGVHAVTPDYRVELADCDPTQAACRQDIFVGTCSDLGQLIAVTGCHDDRPGFIAVAGTDADDVTNRLHPPDYPEVALAVEGFGTLQLDLGPELTEDPAASRERWVYSRSITIFVPEALIEATDVGAPGLQVVADGGLAMREAVEAVLPEGVFLAPNYDLHELDAVARVRMVIYTLSALAVGTALLGLMLTTIDHARERRRVIARQLAIGVPSHTLYAGQVLQALISLIGSVALAAALGQLAVHAWAAAAELQPFDIAGRAMVVTGVTTIGGALVALATVPASRTRLTPSLLRRE